MGLSFATAAALVAVAAAPKPRQPRETYLEVPRVPRPNSFGLAELLVEHPFSGSRGLDANGDGACDEGEFVGAVEAAVRGVASEVWRLVDNNEDGQLDLGELAREVRLHERAGGKATFAAPVRTWPFLWLLSRHFEAADLARSARVSVASAQQTDVTAMLHEVVFLDERRALFDDIAGAGVGDDDGIFGPAEWAAWQERRQRRMKARKRSRRKAQRDDL